MIFEHQCQRCGRLAAYGFGFSSRLGLAGTWFCHEHRREGDNIMISRDEWLKHVPARFVARCEKCGRDLDTREAGTHQWTAGWVKVREGGGGHGISLPERSNRWAHDRCIQDAIAGHAGQHSLSLP